MKFYITEDDMCTTQKLNLARVQKWFEANGSTLTDDPDSADVVLCMTCNGWSLLEEASYDRITALAPEYAERMIVVGCVNDAHPDKVSRIWSGPTVRTRSSEPFSFADIEMLFPEFDVPLAAVPAQSTFRRREDYRDFDLSKRFVNIAEGCAFNCTFCTHKPGLGNRRSRPLAEILDQIAQCVNEGVRTINLMGMETSLWGMEHGHSYADLLQAVLEFHDSYEVHVAQFNASGIVRFADALLPLFQNKRVTDIQAPIQSVSNRLLKMMRRQPHDERIGRFLTAVRDVNTRAILRTDLIVGWPTETREERVASLDFAGRHFDEVALYAIELSPDLPAWKFHESAFSQKELDTIQAESIGYMAERFPRVVVHTGQQGDSSMQAAEAKRKALRDRRNEPEMIELSDRGAEDGDVERFA